ncbi:MAG: glycosyltransferase [Puniceicoccaceae bacterium]
MTDSSDTSTDPNSSAAVELIEANGLRVAIFSDSMPERNGAGAYYNDLEVQLAPRLGGLELMQPPKRRRFALPLPGDSTQKLIFPNLFRIIPAFNRLKPHLVIAVTPGPFGLLGLYLAKRNKIGFMTGFHTHFEGLVQMYGDNLFFRTAFWYLEFVNKILLRRSDTVLINNEDLTEMVTGLGAPNVDVMGTPLAANFIEDPLVPHSGGLNRVLFAGRLAPEKNMPVVIEAVKALPDIEFVLAGDGPLRKEMEAEAEQHSNLRLTGWLDREGLIKEVDASDLLLLPSHMETFGTVALEAMARGKPALVAANAGIHTWPSLKEALFVLEENQNIGTVLEEIRQLPTETWQQKSQAATEAARNLNNETIDQWVGFVKQYSRPRKDD